MDGREIKSKTRNYIIGQLDGFDEFTNDEKLVDMDIMNIKNKLSDKEVLSPGKEKKTTGLKRIDLTGLLFDRLILNETFNKPGPVGRGCIM